MLFGAPCDLRNWILLCERGLLCVERWQHQKRQKRKPMRDIREGGEANGSPMFLPLLVGRSGRRFVMDDRWSPRSRDEVWVAVVTERVAEAHARLESSSWRRVPEPPRAIAEDAGPGKI